MQTPRQSGGNGRRTGRCNTDGGAPMKLPSVAGASTALRSLGAVRQSMLDKLGGGGGAHPGSGASVATTSASRPGSAASVSSPKALGLAARRTRAIGSIEIGLKEQRQVEEKRVDSKQALKRIQKVKTVKKLYSFGDQVMPSCHRGMEIIFATCKKTGEDVIIKVRRKDKSFSSSSAEQNWRMSTEFVLNMPVYEGVAAIYEVLEDDEAYCVVMEKVPGRDLFEALCANEVCGLAEVKEIMRQLLSALDVMHQRGAIHRDLKLENVMFMKINDELRPNSSDDDDGDDQEEPASPASPVAVKLIDFDTVEHYDPATPKHSRHVTGTDQYISQEAYAGVYSPASDIFAVGVIGYRLLTGRFPFSDRVFEDEGGCDTRVGSPHMREIRRRLRDYEINYKHKALIEDPQACNLIRWMLSDGESRRPTADLALDHPWLSGPIRGDVRATRRCATEGFGAPRPRAPRAGPLVSPRQAMVWV